MAPHWPVHVDWPVDVHIPLGLLKAVFPMTKIASLVILKKSTSTSTSHTDQVDDAVDVYAKHTLITVLSIFLCSFPKWYQCLKFCLLSMCQPMYLSTGASNGPL